MVLGVPIGISLGVAAVATIYQYDLGIEMLGVNFSSGIASFPLLAIPFFVFAGVILDRAGLARHHPRVSSNCWWARAPGAWPWSR